MRGRALDRLFARFRRHGDARALAKVFDATAPELYRVATHLAKDLHAAEDLVQSTFLAAIEARESWDESREVMPWLVGILARQAAYERRRRSRSIEPERLERQAAPEPAEAAEAQELSDELARAIDSIPALYREVLLAHLKQGKTPQEIARDLGRAPGTVRVQLHRALEMVRKTLPAGLATGGMIAALSPRGLSAVRAVVVRSAMRVSVPTAAAAAVPTTAAAIGGVLMSSKLVIAITGVALCLVFAGRLVLDREGSQRSDRSAPELARESIASSADAGSGVASTEKLTAPETSHRAPAATPESNPAPDTTIQVIGDQVSGRLLMPDGSPAAQAFVALVRMKDGRPHQSVQERKTDEDGAFVLRSDPGTYVVIGLHQDCLPLVQQAALVRDTDLHLEPATFSEGAHIRGRVRIFGAPAPRDCLIHAVRYAEEPCIKLNDQDLIWSDGVLHAPPGSSNTDDLGRFVIGGLAPGAYQVSVESTPERRILHAVFDVTAPADDVELDVQGARLVLRIMSDHRPLKASLNLVDGQGNIWGFGSQSVVDVLVPPGTVFTANVEKEGYAGTSLDLNIPADGETLEKEIELSRGTDAAELAIELVTSDGRRINAAGFGLFRRTEHRMMTFRLVRHGSDGSEPDIVRNEQAPDGNFRLHDIPPGRYRIEVVAGGTWESGSSFWHADPVEVELGPNALERKRIDLRMGGRLRIRCVNRNGEALPARCKLFDASGAEVPFVFFTKDEHGSTWGGTGALNKSAPRGANETIPSFTPGKYELRVSLDGYRDTSQIVTVEEGRVRDVSIILQDG